MDKPVSAADANRTFSRLLRGIREGKSYVVTSHGKPVARLVPAGEREIVAKAAYGQLLTRLKRQRPVRIPRWTRDELYERDR